MKSTIIQLSSSIPKNLITEAGYELNRLDSSINRAIIDLKDSSRIHVWYLQTIDEKTAYSKVLEFMEGFLGQHKNHQEESVPTIYINKDIPLPYATTEIPDFEGSKLFWVNNEGQVVLGNVLNNLRTGLDEQFKLLGEKYNAFEVALPSFIPITFFEKNWYFMQYPNHLVFPLTIKEKTEVINSFKASVNVDNGKIHDVNSYLDSPQYVLSPATCFHIHHFLDQHPEILLKHRHFTAVSNCYRYESSNIFLMERSNTFNMRELVFYGREDEVEEILSYYQECLIRLLELWGIKGFLQDANDPFYVNNLPKNVEYNLPDIKKWELRLELPYKGKSIACASFNRHGDFFLKNAGINSETVKGWVSGCVAFGLERWIWTIMCQYGTQTENWPDPIRKMSGLQ